MKNPKISIIVPIYNVEQYLETCIGSILTQDFEDFELILVNDGSTDRCGEICDNAVLSDQRIIVIHKENGGLSDARNAGIDVASGDYIMFVDSDDRIYPAALSKLFDACVKNKCDIATSQIREYGIEANVTGNVFKKTSFEALDLIVLRKDWHWSAWGKLYKSSVFSESRFAKGIIFEDFELIPKLIYRTESIAFVDEILYDYIERDESIMGNNRKKASPDMVKIIDMSVRHFKKEAACDKQNLIIAGYLLHGYSKIINIIKNGFLPKNKDFIKIYKKVYRRFILDILKSKHVTSKEKFLIIISSFSVTICQKLYLYKHRTDLDKKITVD